MVNRLFLTLIFLASLTAAGNASAAWNETTLSSHSEGSSSTGANDSVPTLAYPDSSAADINANNGGSALGTGSGSIGGTNDKDVYQFRLLAGDYNASNQVLKIAITSSGQESVNINLDHWSSSWAGTTSSSNGSGTTRITYYSLVGSGNQDFYIEVSSGCGSCGGQTAYSVTISVVSSGTISGNVTALNPGSLANASIYVTAYDSANGIAGSVQTDSLGAYVLPVPAGVSIVRLQAQRYWSSGTPSEPGVGPTNFPVSINLSGGGSAGANFTAYPEATLSGTFSGIAQNNLEITMFDPYTGFQNGGGNNFNLETSSTNYVFHNVKPGNFSLLASDSSSTLASIVKNNVVITDGKTNTQNLVFGSGGSISGTISPAAYNVKIKVLVAGDDHGNQVSEADYSGQTITSWTVSKIPNNSGAPLYDIHVQTSGNGGNPSPYNSTLNVAAGATGVALTGLNLNSAITGTVTDTTGLGTNLSVLAIRHSDVAGNYDQIGSVLPLMFASLTGSGPYTYSVPVDSSVSGGYDLALMNFSNNSGFPPIYAGAESVASGGTQNFTTNSTGGWITGNFTVGGKTIGEIDYQANGSNFIYMFLGTKLSGAGDLSTGTGYTSSNQLPAGAYTVKAKTHYLNEATASTSVSNNVTSTANLNALPNPAQDKFLPYAHQLNPANGQTVFSNPVIKATIGDGSLGTGVTTITSATINSVGASFTYSGGVVTVNHASLTNGSYTVVINFSDTASSPNAGTVSWTFNVALATPTITPTFTNSPIATNTITPTFSRTPTITTTFTRTATPAGTLTHTPTISPTFTFSRTATTTNSYTNSPTLTNTVTVTFSKTATPTYTLTNTKTETKTTTPTVTKTSTRSPTVTPTPAGTSTNTPTISPTFSITQTHTFSPTLTNTPTATLTFTITETHTFSPTYTNTPTSTPTPQFDSSGPVGGVVAGPVPAKAGDPICLYFDKMPGTTRWDIFNLAGDLVSTITYGSDVKQCWQTSGSIAGGVYLCRIAVTYADGSTKTTWQKIAITK